MNKETIITAIVAVIVAVLDLLKIFGIAVPVEDNTIYTIVSLIVAAAVSSVPKHSAVLMDDEGNRIKNEVYIHEGE